MGGLQGRLPQSVSKYLSVEYVPISKNTVTLSQAVQKIDFGGPFGGVLGGKG